MKIEKLIAIIAFCFTIVIIAINIFYPPPSDNRILPVFVSIYLLILDAVLFLIIIIKPSFSVLFAVIFYYEGLVSIVDAETVIGILFIFFAVSLAFKYGFFRKYRILKIIILAFLILVSIIIEVINLPYALLENLFELLLYIVLFIMLYLMFRDDLRRYFQRKPKYRLSEHKISPKEALYLIAFMNGQSIKEIAADHHVDPSTVKTSLCRAYQKLDVPDCKAFIIKTKEMDVIP